MILLLGCSVIRDVIGWAGFVAHVGKQKISTLCCVLEVLNGAEIRLENLGIDGTVILCFSEE